MAVHPDVRYVVATNGDEQLMVAEPLLAAALGYGWDLTGESFWGKEMERWTYHPPFTLLEVPDTHVVVLTSSVTTDSGTGLVHQAPAFGADDLATSRAYGLAMGNPVRPDGRFEPDLPLVGEHVDQLSGLDDAAGAELFRARARAVNTTAALDDALVRAIVRKVEGLPLALELAAARVVSLSLEQVVMGLHEPLDLLAGRSRAADPRHRTMRAVIAWSHDLLDVRDREVFAALSVFVGAFDGDAAGAVVGDGGPDAVDRLLGRSLLGRDRDVGARARYRFLDPVRHFAQEQATPALLDRVRTSHVRLAAQVDDRFRTPDATGWATISRASADDLRAAATYAVAERPRRTPLPSARRPRVGSSRTCTGRGFSMGTLPSSGHGRTRRWAPRATPASKPACCGWWLLPRSPRETPPSRSRRRAVNSRPVSWPAVQAAASVGARRCDRDPT